MAISTAIFGTLAVFGAGATLFVLNRRDKKNPALKIKPRSCEKLLQNQITSDTFDDRVLAKWIRENRAAYTEGRQMLLVHCTKTWLAQLGYENISVLDADKNLIACIVELDTGEVIREQLFSFGTMDEKMKARFNGKAELFLQNS